MQGIRLIKPSLGECVVVTGLGLIGLATVQLLRPNGCPGVGLDFDPVVLAAARDTYPTVRFELCDALNCELRFRVRVVVPRW